MSAGIAFGSTRSRRYAAVFALAFPAVPATAAEPVEARYTSLDLDACTVLETVQEGVGVALVCEGLDGIPVHVTEGDLRFDVDFGVPDDRTDTFAPFHFPGTRIEWRVAGGAPFAAVLRFTIEDTGVEPPSPQRGSVLGIFQVGRDGVPGCPVAYVDALLNEDANTIARQVADAFARPFRCGTDRATYVGRTGPLSGSASATMAD